MKYGSWDMEHDGQNFLSFRAIFCPFTLLTPQKIKILKKWRKCLEILSFYKNVPKTMIICYAVPTFFILGYFWPFYTPRPSPCLSLLDPKKQNIKKNYGVKDIESWMPHLKLYRVQIKYYKVIHKSYKSYWGGSNHHG